MARTVGRYEILRTIGRGGMAVVHLARQTDLDRYVALKELAALHAADPAFARRFVRESRMAGSLSHPNVVTVHDFFEWDGVPMIAMEYLERGSLRPFVKQLDDAQATGVMEGLLAGLAHAEQHGIVHRDIKPENLMVTGDGRIKIADFGIAKAGGAATTMLTATGMAIGTPAYMAPEQAAGREIGPWTDLYAAGCVAFELYCGRLPFSSAESPLALLHQHVNLPPPAPHSVRPDLDPRIAGWIERLLEKLPEDRPANARAAWDELEEIAMAALGPWWRRDARLPEGEGAASAPLPATGGAVPSDERAAEAPAPDEPAATAASPVPPAGRRRRRRRTMAAAGALVTAAAAVAVALAVGGEGGDGGDRGDRGDGSATSRTLPPVNAKFDYQIGGAYRPPDGVRVVSRDWFSAPPAAGVYSICHVNAFETHADDPEVDRPDEQSSWPPGLVLTRPGDDPAAGASPVDISTAANRERAATHVQPMIELCREKGYAAVEYDNLDSWERFDDLPFGKPQAVAYAELLVDRAHELGLAVAQKNGIALSREESRERVGFDFAIAEECGRYDECEDYRNVFGDRVIDIEYRRAEFRAACDAVGRGVSVVYRDRDLTPSGSPSYRYAAC